MASGSSATTSLLSTAGAVPVKNEKGELSMQKVKVTRYIAGKRPDFASSSYGAGGSDSDSSDDEEDRGRKGRGGRYKASVFGKNEDDEYEHTSASEQKAAAESDSRMRRLQQFKQEKEEDERDSRASRRRHIEDPELLASKSEASSSSSEDERPRDHSRRHRSPVESSGDEDEELSDQEYDKRREILRQKAKEKQKEEELLTRQQEEEEEESSEEEETDYEYSDSEDETMPRLKPVFVRKRDRITLQESEKEQKRLEQLQLEQKKAADDRKVQSAKIVETIVKQEVEMEKRVQEDNVNLESVCTDDENEEMAYEAWKIRELKRVKRDREERETLAREKAEWEKIHNMTEEERRAYLRSNPKIITNKQTKSKYKFLQKYFHRGAFFLDAEQNVLTQDFAQPTLEDHFDKTILPKVMQVKDFGKAGRTKWSHLANEDTTDFQSAWTADSAQNLKFFNKHGGGVKEVFERPAAAKKKKV